MNLKQIKDSKFINDSSKSVKKLISFFGTHKKYLVLTSMFLFIVFVFTLSSSFALELPVSSITITSNSLDFSAKESGSWNVTKSAYWTGKDKARIVFDVNTISNSKSRYKTNYVLVVDGSLYQHGATVSSALHNMINNMFVGNNKVALIGFNNTAILLRDFNTNPQVLITDINLFFSGAASKEENTNYYNALVQVDELLQTYTKETRTNVEVVFVTDGKPNVDTPLEVSEYNLLKAKYSDLGLKFRAIQYEMGDDIVDEVKRISDTQVAINSSNIWDILDGLYFGNDYYGEFSISDKIDTQFKIDKIFTNVGNVTVTGKYFINWDLITDTNLFGVGEKAKMVIDISVVGSLPVSYNSKVGDEGTDVTYYYSSKANETVGTSESPSLRTTYNVLYDSNAPTGCTVSNMPSTSAQYIFDIVRPSDKVPTCNGYKFKKWELVTDNVKTNNDGSFIMPYKDVTLRAVWSNASIDKNVDGVLSEKASLYRVLESEALTGGVAKEYTGSHKDNINGAGTNKIYHYYASNDSDATKILDKNNVVFAGFCWQMIRTTDTGGVKMIYNGEVDSNGTCATTRGKHDGYDGISVYYLNYSKHYYGTGYTYDSDANTFSLAGTKDYATWGASTWPDLIGKYTCVKTSSTATCTILYLVLARFDDQRAIVARIRGDSNYSEIGSGPFAMYDDYSNSLYKVGYMYNDLYKSGSISFATSDMGTEEIDTNLIISDDVTYSEDDNNYTLVNSMAFWEIGGTTEELIKFVVGKYAIAPLTETADYVRYIISVDFDELRYYYIELKNGDLMDGYYVYGDSYIVNDDAYTIENPTLITKREFYLNYATYKDKYYGEDKNFTERGYTEDTVDDYIQNDINDNKCLALYRNTSTADDTVVTENYKDYFSSIPISSVFDFSDDFTYSNGSYNLAGNTVAVGLYDTDNFSLINKKHYTCFNASNQCTNIYYVYYAGDKTLYYIELSNGVSISTALENMFDSDNTNTKDSGVKSLIDYWYENNLNSYTSYLEDTIYCNDRTISDLGGFKPDGGSVFSTLKFNGASNSSLTCPKVVDSFSVLNSKAKLKYPVGLLTIAEANLLSSKARSSTSSNWLLTPYGFSGSVLSSYYTMSSGTIINQDVSSVSDIRPVISLRAGINLLSGDGSTTNPYIVDLDS